jgi:hypothetical protein
MIPPFNKDGNLPTGVHEATLEEVTDKFGGTAHRQNLIKGLIAALKALKAAGCKKAYVDGSFITEKSVPGDFDGCWDMTDVDPTLLDPVLLDFDYSRAAQKAKYLGEFFPALLVEGGSGETFLDFFQTDRNTGDPKGIVAIDLERAQL